MFGLCLGKDGGLMQIGGYNEGNHLHDIVWMNMSKFAGSNYQFDIRGFSVGDHLIKGSEKWSVGFVDSGTTFTYIPHALWE